MTPCSPFRSVDASTGYGKIKYAGKVMGAHRAAYIEANGPIPDGMHVGHACHDADLSCEGGRTCPHRRCVNLDHLVLQSPAENSRAAARNLHPPRPPLKTVCVRGHDRTDPANIYANGNCRLCGGITKYGKPTVGIGTGSRGGRGEWGKARSNSA